MNQLKKYFFIATLMCFAMTTTAQWTPGSTGNPSGVTHCFIESPGTLLSGGNGSGIFSSTNNGNTWTVSNTGIVAGDEILCFGKNSAGIFAGSNSLIYFSTNNGASWSIINSSGNAVFAFAFLTDTIYAATMGGGVIMSINNGSTWTTANTGITTNSVYSIVKKGNLLFAGTVSDGIFVSSDSGASWSPVNTGLPSPIVIRCLETDGTNLYAGTNLWLFPAIPACGMYISSNNGASWTQVTGGIPASLPVFAITKVGNAVLAAAHDIYRSLDNGATWSIFMNGINPTCSYGAAGFLETDSFIFSGFEGGCIGSIFRINKSEVVSGIESPEQNISCSIFPNPCFSQLNIQNNTAYPIHFTLYNFSGEIILRRYLTEKTSTIDLSANSNGIYFYTVFNNRHLMKSGKIIKQ